MSPIYKKMLLITNVMVGVYLAIAGYFMPGEPWWVLLLPPVVMYTFFIWNMISSKKKIREMDFMVSTIFSDPKSIRWVSEEERRELLLPGSSKKLYLISGRVKHRILSKQEMTGADKKVFRILTATQKLGVRGHL